MRNTESFKRKAITLENLFKADQEDRSSELWKKNPELMKQKDDKRLAKVIELVENNKLVKGSDYLQASMLLQHGNETKHYEMAHVLAQKAVEMNYEPKENEPDPLLMIAVTKDRLLMSSGQPQLYGTQYVKGEGDKWKLWEVDPNITDEDRAKMHVDSLEESMKFLDEMNAEDAEDKDR